ncbi:MAG: hypothetical protein LPD71_10060 [Shewanella sp.]|nr:hypothetical protein [Shewanella sp.]MCF1432100.1 hypothetical protein [Shewanella sp.]MCF1439066.1 hypothetical protein [Shewanella sp.]MCF1458370.1 hypothetical protein [Shewanella sp.]
MNVELIKRTLAPYGELRLSALDNLRLIASVLAQSDIRVETFIACASGQSGRPRYWVQIADIWIDCGRDNDYRAQFSFMLEPVSLLDAQCVQVALLDEHRIALMCMQSAHFDHCESYQGFSKTIELI